MCEENREQTSRGPTKGEEPSTSAQQADKRSFVGELFVIVGIWNILLAGLLCDWSGQWVRIELALVALTVLSLAVDFLPVSWARRRVSRESAKKGQKIHPTPRKNA
jgi:hypothetical protein